MCIRDRAIPSLPVTVVLVAFLSANIWNIDVYKRQPQNSWLVPVWVFELEGCTINHLDGDRKGRPKKETVVLSAVDGGYVSPVQEMDFFN